MKKIVASLLALAALVTAGAATAASEDTSASEAEVQHGWAGYLDYAYVYSSAEPAALQARLEGYGREAGITLERYITEQFEARPGGGSGPVDEARVRPDEELVLEIGPGPGNLTRFLIRTGAPLIAMEMDVRFREPVLEALGHPKNLTWIEGDVLAGKSHLSPVLLDALGAAGAGTRRPLVLVANLPYAVATPVLTNLLEAGLGFRGGVVTVQEEVARRLVAVDPMSSESLNLLAAAFQLQRLDDSTLAVLERREALTFEVKIDMQQEIEGGFMIQGRLTNPKDEEASVPELTPIAYLLRQSPANFSSNSFT